MKKRTQAQRRFAENAVTPSVGQWTSEQGQFAGNTGKKKSEKPKKTGDLMPRVALVFEFLHGAEPGDMSFLILPKGFEIKTSRGTQIISIEVPEDYLRSGLYLGSETKVVSFKPKSKDKVAKKDTEERAQSVDLQISHPSLNGRYEVTMYQPGSPCLIPRLQFWFRVDARLRLFFRQGPDTRQKEKVDTTEACAVLKHAKDHHVIGEFAKEVTRSGSPTIRVSLKVL